MICPQDVKYVEHIEYVEFASHDADVRVNDIHLEAPHATRPGSTLDFAASGGRSSASLLTLPVELRLRMYEMAYNATFIHSKLRWNNGLKLQLRGTQSDRPEIRLTGSPFTLLRVCRSLYTEVVQMLPPISSVGLELHNFSAHDLHHWLDQLDDVQIAQIRLLSITGWSRCRLKQPLYPHPMSCERSRASCSVDCLEKEHDGYDRWVPASLRMC